MKKVLFFAAALMLAATATAQTNVQAQEFPPLPTSKQTGLVTLYDTLHFAGIMKSDLYEYTLQWLAAENSNNYSTAAYANKEMGIIIAHKICYFIADVSGGSGIASIQEVQYTLTIRIQDGFIYTQADHIKSLSNPKYPQYGGWGFAEEWTKDYANGIHMPNAREKFRLRSFANKACHNISLQILSLYKYMEQCQTYNIPYQQSK